MELVEEDVEWGPIRLTFGLPEIDAFGGGVASGLVLSLASEEGNNKVNCRGMSAFSGDCYEYWAPVGVYEASLSIHGRSWEFPITETIPLAICSQSTDLYVPMEELGAVRLVLAGRNDSDPNHTGGAIVKIFNEEGRMLPMLLLEDAPPIVYGLAPGTWRFGVSSPDDVTIETVGREPWQGEVRVAKGAISDLRLSHSGH